MSVIRGPDPWVAFRAAKTMGADRWTALAVADAVAKEGKLDIFSSEAGMVQHVRGQVRMRMCSRAYDEVRCDFQHPWFPEVATIMVFVL